MAVFGFASYEIYPTTPGGAGVFLDATIELLIAKGHGVVLILAVPDVEFEAWTKQDLFRYTRPDLISSYHLDALCEDMIAERWQFPSSAHWASYRFAHALKKVFEEIKCDYFEFFDYCGPAYYSLISRAKDPALFPPVISVRIHTTIEMIDRATRSPFEEFRINDYALERASISLADMILCSGKHFISDEVLSLYKIDREKIIVSPWPCRDRNKIERLPNAQDVIFVGRLSTLKAVDRFLHAAVAILSNEDMRHRVGNFIVIGPRETVSSSQSEAQLREIAGRWLENRIKFVGKLTHTEMMRYLKSAICAVFPNRMESFCYAAHELHLQGVPLIVSESATFRDFFQEGETAIFFDDRISSLVECILRLAADHSLRAKLSESASLTRARYGKCSYEDYLISPSAVGQKGSDPSITYLVVGKDLPSAIKSIAAMRSSLPFGEWLILLRGDAGARIGLFGDFWEMRTADGRILCPQTHPIGDCFTFVDPARPPRMDFIAGSVAILAYYARVVAVVPSSETSGLSWIASSIPISLEMYESSDKLIGGMFRGRRNLSLVDLFATNETETEMGLLLRLREIGGIIVDLPGKAWLHEDRATVFRTPSLENERLLLRYAWSLAPAPISIMAERFRRRHVFISHGEAAMEHQWSAISAEAEANPQRLYIVANVKKQELVSDPAFVTLVRVFAGGSILGRPWSYVQFDGAWESVPVADYPAGFRRTSARMSCASVPMDRSLRLNFLVGPDQGHITIIHESKVWEHSLTAKSHNSVSIAVGEVFANAAAVQGRLERIQEIQLPRWTDMPAWPDMVMVIAGEKDRMIANLILESIFADRAGSIPIVSLDVEQYGNAAAAEALKRHSEGRTIIAVFNWSFADTICAAAAGSNSTRFDLVLWHNLNWRFGYSALLQLERITHVAKSHSDRVRVTVFNENLKDVLARLGAASRVVDLVFSDSFRDGSHPICIDVLIGPAPNEFPACGHIAAAFGLVQQNTLNSIRTIVIPNNEPLLRNLLLSFGVGHKTLPYVDAEIAIRQITDAIVIYLAPWPTGDLDSLAISVVRSGGIAIVGPGAVPPSMIGLNRVLRANYWEDSTQIALELRTAVTIAGSLIDDGGLKVWNDESIEVQ